MINDLREDEVKRSNCIFKARVNFSPVCIQYIVSKVLCTEWVIIVDKYFLLFFWLFHLFYYRWAVPKTSVQYPTMGILVYVVTPHMVDDGCQSRVTRVGCVISWPILWFFMNWWSFCLSALIFESSMLRSPMQIKSELAGISNSWNILSKSLMAASTAASEGWYTQEIIIGRLYFRLTLSHIV